MNLLIARVALLAITVAGCTTPAPFVAAPAAPAADLAIHGVNVVDVETGTVLPDRTVLIRGSRIAAVLLAAEARPGPGTRIVDGGGAYLIPGLWDVHTHLPDPPLDSAVILPSYVVNGVTTVRDMWSDPPDVPADSVTGFTILQSLQRTRDQIAAGRLVGPRILTATAPLDGPFGPDGFVNVIRTSHDAANAVARAAASGVDAVSIYPWLGPDGYAAAAAAARQHGVPLAGLVPISTTFEEMAAAGHRVRDAHLEWSLGCSSVGDSVRAELRAAAGRDAASVTPADSSRILYRLFGAARPRLRETFDAERCASLARAVARDGIWQTPRMVYGRPETSGGRSAAAAARFLPQELRSAWQQRVARVERDSTGVLGAEARHEREIYRILHAAGIPLLVGTESYHGSAAAWGFSVHDELVELVGIGLTPAAALRAGTSEPARALGMADSLGTVAAGKLADLVLLDANPLADIRNTQRIRAVIVNGRLLDRAALDSVLDRLQRAASP